MRVFKLTGFKAICIKNILIHLVHINPQKIKCCEMFIKNDCGTLSN